ncbi:hypothetical protein K466DRAFT_593109 [Polyporus arcularius HHB13444]|uniref:F-box domain-containing protein n=1 Tax=Polyporus arcularius HHB13444 TaxID=1314778 RepID=A0A5C3Q983_9APHY|nr:hypothetical protein K466DRAFT_593109 [Polyporus arcularius HHB13444]
MSHIDDESPTTSASHRLLETYDILWRIFSSQHTRGAQSPYTLSRTDLARLVRVCRSFHDPAVRVLWSSLDGFEPLWQLLAPPTLPWFQYNEEHLQRIVNARLWDNSECWDRFVKYSQYVLTLRVSMSHTIHEHGYWATASIWNKRLLQHLLEHNRGEPILPSLRSLSWSWVTIQDAYLPSILCPSLSELVIIYHISHRTEQTSFVNVIRDLQGASSPRLATFILQGSNDAGHRLVDELVLLQNLRKISLPYNLLLEEVHALLTMPNLTSLTAKVTVEDVSEASVTARSLHSLAFHGSSPDLTRLFATLTLPYLESLELSIFDTTPCGPKLPLCTATIAAALESKTLRRLHLTFNAAYDSNQPPPTDPSVSLSALLLPFLSQTPRLETLNLRFDGPLKLWANDDVFDGMAQAWPSLRTLRLDFRAWHESGPVPTPAILTRFARFCPRLHELVLPYLNYRIDVDTALYKELHHHALRRLFIADDRSMGTVDPDHILPLAQMIADLFPHLDLSFRAYIKSRGMPWWKVFDCLRASPKRPSARGLLHAASHSYLP